MDIAQLTLNADEQKLIQQLLAAGQEHLFADWDVRGMHDDAKREFLKSLMCMNNSYPGGLVSYINNARNLLAEAKSGANPFDGFVPHQPDITDLTKFDTRYDHYEALGQAHFEKVAVVLVAGGLGERLGYSGIKLDIPVEVTETTPYLAHYAACLKAMEARMQNPHPVPLIIMVSEDTQAKTVASLENNNYYGLQKEQIHILKQELVPALADNAGHLALEEKYKLILKPHGHGDVHMLLHSSGLAKKYAAAGIEHFIFIQDTNGQVFNALPAALGVSVEKKFDFNSLAVNRIPGEAVGGLARLVKGGTELTLNIEYNQLDPLLRATVNPAGDVPNEQGWSIFPGNINVLIIKLSSYVKLLERTHGIIAEFVNPKYADASRSTFKQPTRLETMMQDLPKLFGPDEKTGVSVFDRRWAFSANKNNIKDAAEKQASGGPPESAATAESDFYLAGRMKLAAAGVEIETAPEKMIRGINIIPGPRVILHPSFAMTLAEVRKKISGGKISGEATLSIAGENVLLEHIELAGNSALVIRAGEDTIALKNVKIENAGFELIALTDAEQNDPATPEHLRLRGYRIENRGAEIYSGTK
ncbi:MAG: UTP--glucose-1-phosphate uridylyltransferase [Kiritimatiellales bacterium]